MKYVADVDVQLKESILDPQGDAVRSALVSMGHEGVRGVRIGKRIRVELDAVDEAECRRIVEQICSQLLANASMETYEYEIREESGQ